MLAFVVQTFAIEGLNISVQNGDVVLSWPSKDYETYIVQYRPSFATTDMWVTLANNLPGEAGQTVTHFIHSSIAQPQMSATSGGILTPQPKREILMNSLTDIVDSSVTKMIPMAMPANGLDSAAPLVLFPPGFDLSDFITFEPSTGQWTSGSGFSINQPTLSPGLNNA